MEAGRIIGGKYRIRRLIGEGGMGAVWSAVHEALDRTVAIKFLRPLGADAETASARFVTEAKSAARVKHRFVVDVFDFGITEDGVYYMVQELLEGEELADCIVQGPAWEVRDVVSFICQCLSGLEAVHQAGIVHRDLKPENIFVMRDSDGRYPKLLDFGISKRSDTNSPRTSGRPASRPAGRPKQVTTTGTTVGTPWYMSPEQLRGRRDLDGRADLYSIGVILYEWLAGRVPYEQDNVAELALQIASGSATPLVTFRPELGHALSSIVARALAPEPEGRFATASAMRDALTEILPSLPSGFSVVQKAGKAAPIGARTELLLKAAANAFGEEHGAERGLGGFSRFSRVRPWMLAVGASVVVGLLLLPFVLHPEPQRAGAAHAEPTVRPAAAPEPAAPLDPSPKAAVQLAPTAVDPALSPARGEPTPAGPVAEASSTSRSASEADAKEERRSSRTRTKGGARKKVIRRLDF